MTTAPVIIFDRHRIQCDGQGVTTLVIFHGCPLRCRWCGNPYSYAPDTQRESLTPQELYEKVKIDALYFEATGGGVTFGGGEPLLYPDFLTEFRKICPDTWHLCAETSLSVPWKHVQKAAQAIDMFYIDCKDADPDIYKRYTGKDNSLMIDNLKKLLTVIPPEKIILRLPLIPEYNSEQNRAKSRRFFEGLGITQFDEFTYTIQ